MPNDQAHPPRRALNQVAAFQYVTVENAPTYRAIMQVFFDARQRYVIELRGSEVLELLRASTNHFELADEAALDYHLGQLVTWGNLAHAHDPGAVSRLEDFYKRRFVYHLTSVGEAAHRAVLEVEATAGRSGSLQSTMLAKIRDALVELARQGAEAAPSADVVFGLLHDLQAAFGTLTEEANHFISEIDRSDTGPAAEERFLLYKQALLAYISRFIEQLRRLGTEIRTAIEAVDAAGSARLIDLASRSNDLPPSLGHGDPAARWRDEQQQRWAGMRAWFAGDRSTGSAPTVERLAQVARDAVISLTRTLMRLNERRTRPVDRAADFRTLARWFARASDDGAAHVLWRSAFGLAAARHFVLVDDDPDLVAANTSWWDAPPVEIPVRLRTHGALPTAGRPSQVPNHELARQWIAQKRRREQAVLQEALRRFSGRGPLTISGMHALTEPEFEVFLTFIDEALTSPRQPDGSRVARSSDGRFRITLVQPPGDTLLVRVETPVGHLYCADYRIQVDEASAARPTAEASR
ncbi:MAG: TIGR02677 family protein [Deltaproteobacteria bacterium]|nr:TIGR02677 family protein [Deltaproteobacteria bacterium]